MFPPSLWRLTAEGVVVAFKYLAQLLLLRDSVQPPNKGHLLETSTLLYHRHLDASGTFSVHYHEIKEEIAGRR